MHACANTHTYANMYIWLRLTAILQNFKLAVPFIELLVALHISWLNFHVQLVDGGGSKAFEERPAVVNCGSEHTAVISWKGQLVLCGLAGHGETGIAESAMLRPAHPCAALRMVSVCCGAHHTLALSEACPRFFDSIKSVNNYTSSFCRLQQARTPSKAVKLDGC